MSLLFDLDIIPGEKPPKIRVSQFDVGRDFGARLFNNGDAYTIVDGSTAKVEGSIGRYGFSEDATIDQQRHIVNFTLTEEMTAVNGPVWCKIKLEKNDVSFSTCAFILDVNRAAVDPTVILGAPGFEQQIKDGVNDYIDAHPEVYEKVNMYRGQITSGSLNDYRDNGWWVISTSDRPNVADVPDGANNICYLFSYTISNGSTYQIFRTVFGQEWTRRLSTTGEVATWRQAGYSSSSTPARELFVEMLNRKAARLGMQDTLYDNPSFALTTPPNVNYTSVKDILRLAVAANSSRVFKEYFGLESATIYTGDELTPTITLKNLLASPGKTGVGYHFPTEIVSSLPTVGTIGTTYLIQTSSDPISYDEYMYLDGAFTKISTTKDPLKPHTIIGSLFQRLKDIGFTVVGAKSGSRSYSTESEVDTIFNMACVAYDETYDETYAVAILDADSVVRVYDATVEAFAYARYRAHTSDYENPSATSNMLSAGVKAVSGCRIISESPYFGNEFRNVDHGFLFEEQVEKDFTTGLAPGESERDPYIQVSASVYKILCVLVAEDTIGNWNSKYQVSSYDASRLGSGKNLQAGYIMTVEDLAIDMALVSSNQATCCIAAYCGGKMLYSNYSGR